MRKRPAIGIAQDDPVSSRRFRFFDSLEGVLRIILVAVEKMFGIKENLITMFFQIGDALKDHAQIFIQTGGQGIFHVQVPGFSEESHYLSFGFQQSLQNGIVFHFFVRIAGTAEGGDPGLRKVGALSLLKKIDISGI